MPPTSTGARAVEDGRVESASRTIESWNRLWGSMKRLRRLGTVGLMALLVSACASPEPSGQNLKDSYFEQVAAAGIARDLVRYGQ